MEGAADGVLPAIQRHMRSKRGEQAECEARGNLPQRHAIHFEIGPRAALVWLQCVLVELRMNLAEPTGGVLMANSTYYKTDVEPFERAELERIHGVRFESKVLPLTTSGTHEFDAVAVDGSIVASIKSPRPWGRP